MKNIEDIKTKLNELISIGYKIIYNETDLPENKQAFDRPSIIYLLDKTKTKFTIEFETKHQEFTVKINDRKKIWFEGKTCDSDYEYLKVKLKNYGTKQKL